MQGEEPSKLFRISSNVPPYAGPPVPRSGDAAGTLLASVNPVDALTGMIVVSRAYELNARMIQMQDSVNEDAVNRVGRIG